ncbi:tautomerase family protein [Streptomyces aureus]|uniref:4-oxalocrotonate tautomerase family protein n=1 Tax=Streptomyces aureus TaxID=193461 RepID=A0ABV4T278_9ACTN
MPIYTCTTTQGSLTSEVKALLAAEITRIHVDINHVPPAYVNVVFSELPTDSIFAGGQPAKTLILTGWVRRGHPQKEGPDWPWSCPQRSPGSPAPTRARPWWYCRTALHGPLSRVGTCCPNQARKRSGCAGPGPEQRARPCACLMPEAIGQSTGRQLAFGAGVFGISVVAHHSHLHGVRQCEGVKCHWSVIAEKSLLGQRQLSRRML